AGQPLHYQSRNPTRGKEEAVSIKLGVLLAALATLAVTGALAAVTLLPGAGAAPVVVPATATNQHFTAVVHTDFGGNFTVPLQVPVNPADVVVKLASGGDHLGGENPSFATVNF